MSSPAPSAPRPLRVGVIGAGLAGLAAARALGERGHAAVVFDKGRGPGGRASSRRAAPFAFDHGAQYFTARDPDFRRRVAAWVAEGVVARWDGRLVALREGRVHPVRGADERFVGVPAMSALARHLARGLDLRSGVRVAALERLGQAHGEAGGRWSLAGEDGAPLGTFDRLVLTLPPAQAAELLGAAEPLAARAAGLVLRPCWAVLLGLAEPWAVPFDGAFCEDAALAWVARDSSKPGRPPHEAWVLHASPQWSEARLAEPPERVIAALVRALERLAKRPLPALRHRDAHLWRHASPADDSAGGPLLDRERGLVLAGDATLGGRVEGAWLSGAAAAALVR